EAGVLRVAGDVDVPGGVDRRRPGDVVAGAAEVARGDDGAARCRAADRHEQEGSGYGGRRDGATEADSAAHQETVVVTLLVLLLGFGSPGPVSETVAVSV